MDENARRLQDVVDKGPWLIYQDDQLAGAKVFPKNRSTIWLSSNQNQTGGYTKNGHLYSLWSLRVFGDVLRINQCSRLFHVPHEFGIHAGVRQVRRGLH